MTTNHILNEAEIATIIAEKFKVHPRAGTVESYTEAEGYGMGEHNVQKVRATVSTHAEIQQKQEA